MTADAFPVLVDGARCADAAAIPRGSGVFDTLLAEEGVRWFEDRHLARLRAACARFGLDAFERWDVAAELARYHALLPARRAALIRTSVVRDPGKAAPSIVMESRAPRSVPAGGVELLLVPAEPDPLGAWKTTERAARDAHAAEAGRAGCFDALLALPTGEVVEAAHGNLFAVVDGVVRTPPLGSGCLPGVVRGLLLESLEGVAEEPLRIEDLRRASEVWTTASGVRVCPVRRIRDARRDQVRDLPGSAGAHVRAAADRLRGLEAAYRDRTARS